MNDPIYYYTMTYLDWPYRPKSCMTAAPQDTQEFRIGFRKFLTLIQEKQCFHQQHLRTCVNGCFLYAHLDSACAQEHVFVTEGTRSEVYWASLKGVGTFSKDPGSFWRTLTFQKKLSNLGLSLSVSKFSPFTFTLITCKLDLFPSIWCFPVSMSPPIFFCS